MKRVLTAGLCLLLIFQLTGCTSSLLTERSIPTPPLAPVREGPSAPTGDIQTIGQVSAVVYVPNAERTRLNATVAPVSIEQGESMYEAVVRVQLEHLQGDVGLSSGQTLSLHPSSNAVEVSRGVATVNLAVSARVLAPEVLFMVRMAITNALTELDAISYVSVLVEGREEGLDIASLIPTGVLSGYPSGDIQALWNQLEVQRTAVAENKRTNLSKAALLYFVSPDGRYILPEVRSMIFAEQDPAKYALQLLDELSKGSATPESAKKFVPPTDYLATPPTMTTPTGTAEHLLELHFRREVDDFLRLQEGTRGMMIASIAYTMFGFLPGLDGIKVTVADRPVTEVTDGDGLSIAFAGDWITRADFQDYVAGNVRLYFASADQKALVPVDRPVPQHLTEHPRTLLRQLLLGPQPHDLWQGLGPIMPAGVADADILGIERLGDTMLINLSEAFADALEGLDAQAGRNWVYGVVNTLTEIAGVKRVRFYVEGKQRDALMNAIALSGEFLRHPGIIRWNAP